MKDEIKEILSYLKKKENTRRIKCITIEETKVLLDYITNLQTIEQQYSAILSENAELENRTKELEQINEEHRKINGELRKAINEAIEYIKSNLDNTNWLELGSQDVEVLLNILQGSDE